MKNNREYAAYYLTLFKVEGHTRWRASLKQTPDGFDKDIDVQPTKPPVITEKRVLKIDRITGEIEIKEGA